ncbi:hypothetical protein Brsp07_02023 [Brucella sp. NBRC 14130]
MMQEVDLRALLHSNFLLAMTWYDNMHRQYNVAMK